jgi:predicted transcriptional regulator
MVDGMSLTSYRTTFALDAKTAMRLKKLAKLWRVSQAEVVRRAIAQAEKESVSLEPDPIAQLKELHAKGGGLDRKTAESYLAQVRQDRKQWRGK